MFAQKENVYLRVSRLILSLSKLKQKERVKEREWNSLTADTWTFILQRYSCYWKSHLRQGTSLSKRSSTWLIVGGKMSDDGTNGRINICLASARRKSIKNCVARRTPYVCKSEVGTTAKLGFTSRVHRINLLYWSNLLTSPRHRRGLEWPRTFDSYRDVATGVSTKMYAHEEDPTINSAPRDERGGRIRERVIVLSTYYRVTGEISQLIKSSRKYKKASEWRDVEV